MRTSSKRGQLRIIGGQWRGRKLNFPEVADLRPTADRVRETLFNWLQTEIPGAHCLDLFAGSGALGLEALSRGAAEVVMVEQNPGAAQQITTHLKTLNCNDGQVINRDAFQFLNGEPIAFDIVFLDPPYRMDCLKECCHLLEDKGWLKQKAFIYMEAPSKSNTPELPQDWDIIRNKKAGDVAYYLITRNRLE